MTQALCDMWGMVGSEHSLKISPLQLLWHGIGSVLKILNKRMTHLMNYLINDKGVYKPRLQRVC